MLGISCNKKHKKLMEKGVAMLDKEFDIFNIITQVRELSGKPTKVVNLKYKNTKITDFFEKVENYVYLY